MAQINLKSYRKLMDYAFCVKQFSRDITMDLNSLIDECAKRDYNKKSKRIL